MMIDWVNTPGGYYAIAYFISCVMMIENSSQKLERKWKVGSIALFGILLYTIMSVTHGSSELLFIPFMLLYFGMMWLVIFVNCTYDARTAIYFAARSFIIGEFIASLEWEIFYYLVSYNILPLNEITNVCVLVAVDGLCIAMLYYLEKKNRNVNKKMQINARNFFSVTVITLAIFATSNLSYVFQTANLGGMIISQLFMVRTLVDLGGVAILYAYHVQLDDLNMRYEVERLQDVLEMQQHNYEMLEQSVDVVNQKYHDLKYQIAILKSEAGTQEGMNYLNQMEQEIKAYEARNKTGNKVLDTILTGKSLYCQNHWIELTSVADGEALDFMEPMDISSLFGNMIDNAIESVIKIEKKERRLIHLAVTKQKNFLRIRMENCYDQEPRIEKGVLVTSKSDEKYHGFGIKSIQSIVKKYGGSTTIQAEDGWFEIRILIPLKW